MRRIRKRDGRAYEVRVKDADGWRWVSTGTHDRIAAQSHLRECERRAADPAYDAEAQAETESLLRDYLISRRARGRSEGTLHHYRVKFGALVRLLPRRAADITHATLERYVLQRKAEGVQTTTIKKEFRALSAALNLARKNGRFSRDPAAIVPELADGYTPRKRYLTRDELAALCAQLTPARAAHVAWIVATGCRWSESLRARAEDVRGEHVWVRGTKTAQSADKVPILSNTRPLIEFALHNAGGRSSLHAPWASVRRDLAAACKRAGIAPVSPNDLRRTTGTWLRQGGAEPALVGQMLRHADARMAERVYGRLDVSEFAAVVEQRLEAGRYHIGTKLVTQTDTSSHLLTPQKSKSPLNSVPRDGIEPPTRGFSIPYNSGDFPANVSNSCAPVPHWYQDDPQHSGLSAFDLVDRYAAELTEYPRRHGDFH